MKIRQCPLVMTIFLCVIIVSGCKPVAFVSTDDSKKENGEEAPTETEVAQTGSTPPVKPSVETEGIPGYTLLCKSTPGHIIPPPREVIYCQLNASDPNSSPNVDWKIQKGASHQERVVITPVSLNGPGVLLDLNMDSKLQRDEFVNSTAIDLTISGQKATISLGPILSSERSAYELKDICPGHPDDTQRQNPCPPAERDLALWWSFNEKALGDGSFKGSVGDNGVYTGNDDSRPNVGVEGKNGPGIEFGNVLSPDGAPEVINSGFLRTASYKGPTKPPFTVSVWVRPRQLVARRVIFQWGDINAQPNRGLIRLRFRLDKLQINFEPEVIEVTQPFTPNQWYHIAVVAPFRGEKLTLGDIKIYINGQLANGSPLNGVSPDTEVTISTAGGDGSTFFQVGKGYDIQSHFRGTMDDFKLYHRALSSEEIKAQYDSYGN